MQAGDSVTVGGQPNSLGELLGRGVMGAVYALQAPINDRKWVVKAAIAGEAQGELEAEYEAMTKIAAAMEPPFIPRVKAASDADGTFLLAMESVGEQYQLSPWIQQQLNSINPLQGEAAVWGIARDYLALTQTVHQALGVSVTDRKIADLRYLPEEGNAVPRLIVIDWGLRNAQLDVAADITIFAQMWYAMTTMSSIGAQNVERLHLLHPSWGDALSIGGRMILARCLQKQVQSIDTLISVIDKWRTQLLSASPTQLAAIADRPAGTNEREREAQLRTLDLLKRADPTQAGRYQTFVNEYYQDAISEIDRVRRQAQRSRADAQRTVSDLYETWQKDWQSLVPIVERWQRTFDQLEHVDSERDVLGKMMLSIPRDVAGIRATLEEVRLHLGQAAHLDDDLAKLQDHHKLLQDLLSALPSGAAQTEQLLKQLSSELQAVLFLLESDRALYRGDFAAALASLQAISAIKSMFSQHKIDPVLLMRVNERIASLEDAQTTDALRSSYVQEITNAISKGDVEGALEVYQQAQLYTHVQPGVRAIWAQLAEPLYLIQQVQSADDATHALNAMAAIYGYQKRKGLPPALAQPLRDALDKPYAAFQQLMAKNDPMTDAMAAMLGNYLLDVNDLCDQLIQHRGA